MLKSIIEQAAAVATIGAAEVQGLLGRIYKQAWIDHAAKLPSLGQRSFALAYDAYYKSYVEDRRQNYWHGINCVALLKKAERDDLDISGRINPDELNDEILRFLNQKETENEKPICWELATQLEALIAQADIEKAEKKALEYMVCPHVDAFEIRSTSRQLREVWRLRPGNGPGRYIMSVLNAGLLRKEG